jgi:flagellar capping protein FliD
MLRSQLTVLSFALMLGACGDAGSPASSSSSSKPSATATASAKASSKPAAVSATATATAAATATASADAAATASGGAPSAVASASAAKKCKERGYVTGKELEDGFKANPGEWVGCTIKMKGELNSVSYNKWVLTPAGLQGPDEKGTWFSVDFFDLDADRKGPLSSCNIEAGKTYDELLAAIKSAGGTLVEVSGPVEASFGNIAPCTVASIKPKPKPGKK